jgi:hypothetical protein
MTNLRPRTSKSLNGEGWCDLDYAGVRLRSRSQTRVRQIGQQLNAHSRELIRNQKSRRYLCLSPGRKKIPGL